MTSDTLPRRAYVGLGLAAAAGGGLVVRRVAPRSSAEAAGIQSGDVITQIAGEVADALPRVRDVLRQLRPGAPVGLTRLRSGHARTIEMTVAEYPLEQFDGARVKLDHVTVAGRRLRALYVLPDGPGPHPAVYFLPGAHWASEEYPLNPEHPVPSLLATLARRGFASLRVERSGLGDSEGPACTTLGFLDEFEGYRAGLHALLEHSEVDAARVVLLGHSLGAMVAPLLATGERVRGIIGIAPSALSIADALTGAVVRHAEHELDRALAERRAKVTAEVIDAVVRRRQTPAELFAERPELRSLAPTHFDGDQAYHRTVRFYHELEAQDLAQAWRATNTDVLLLHGTRDFICTEADAAHIATLVGDRAEHIELDGVDHQMSDRGPGAPERLAPTLAHAVTDWLDQRSM